MKSNVLSFTREVNAIPDDLMRFPEIIKKYNLKYGFLYKWAVLNKAIKTYDRGGIAISEKDLLEFLDERAKKWQA